MCQNTWENAHFHKRERLHLPIFIRHSRSHIRVLIDFVNRGTFQMLIWPSVGIGATSGRHSCVTIRPVNSGHFESVMVEWMMIRTSTATFSCYVSFVGWLNLASCGPSTLNLESFCSASRSCLTVRGIKDWASLCEEQRIDSKKIRHELNARNTIPFSQHCHRSRGTFGT